MKEKEVLIIGKKKNSTLNEIKYGYLTLQLPRNESLISMRRKRYVITFSTCNDFDSQEKTFNDFPPVHMFVCFNLKYKFSFTINLKYFLKSRLYF